MDKPLIVGYVLFDTNETQDDNTIHFFDVSTNRELGKLNVSVPIYDIDLNNFFVVATSQITNRLYVYRVTPGFSEFQLIQNISLNHTLELE